VRNEALLLAAAEVRRQGPRASLMYLTQLVSESDVFDAAAGAAVCKIRIPSAAARYQKSLPEMKVAGAVVRRPRHTAVPSHVT